MTDALSRLTSALADRYTIERELRPSIISLRCPIKPVVAVLSATFLMPVSTLFCILA